MVFGPVVAVVAHWFKKRKGLALGVMAFGSSTGATVYPVIVRKLIDAVGCVLFSFSSLLPKHMDLMLCGLGFNGQCAFWR